MPLLDVMCRVILRNYTWPATDVSVYYTCIYHIYRAKVRLGSSSTPLNDEYRFEEGVRDFKIQDFTIHKEYEKSKARFDLAVITLDKPVIYSTVIFPICLPSVEDTKLPLNHYSGHSVTLTGWGNTDPTAESVATLLQEVSLKIQDQR